jgi:hypothetical protein
MEDGPSDYRSDRMPSAEGRGQAKDATDRLLEAHPDWAERIPFARQFGVKTSIASLGFWLVWQSSGGFDGLRKLGMPETTIWRYVRNFREGFGVHPDEYVLEGVDLDVVRANWLREGGPRALHSREDLKKRTE